MLALASEPNTSIQPAWISQFSAKELAEMVNGQLGKIRELRAAYGNEASAFQRLSNSVADSVLAVSAAAAVPLLLEAFPRFKRIGRGSMYVDGHAVAAALVLVTGIVLATLGKDGGRTVLAAGQGIAAGYSAVLAQRAGQQWFGPKALAA